MHLPPSRDEYAKEFRGSTYLSVQSDLCQTVDAADIRNLEVCGARNCEESQEGDVLKIGGSIYINTDEGTQRTKARKSGPGNIAYANTGLGSSAAL